MPDLTFSDHALPLLIVAAIAYIVYVVWRVAVQAYPMPDSKS